MIENHQFRLNRFEVIGSGSIAEVIERWLGKSALRWYIAQITDTEIVVEASFLDGEIFAPAEGAAERPWYGGKSVAVSIIPTGIGCELGGYAGDAAPATSLLASAVDYLVTNPNAVNASDFISLDDGVLYTEGLCLDLFMKGAIDLYLPAANRIGLLVEKCSPEALDVIFNVVNAVRAVHGVEVVDCLVTDQPIGSRCVENASGAFVGVVDRLDVAFDGCERLLAKGANAIAITTQIQDLPEESYVRHFAGDYPNPMGGVEAIISHAIVNRFQVPAAHAPLLNRKDLDLERGVVDARGAGEMSSASGLACTLVGLRRAPQLTAARCPRPTDIVNVRNVLALVAPAGALGGIPAIFAHKHGIPIVAVRENRTVLEVRADQLGFDDVIGVGNYLEAAGVLLALRRGLHPASIRRPLPTLHHAHGRQTAAKTRSSARSA